MLIIMIIIIQLGRVNGFELHIVKKKAGCYLFRLISAKKGRHRAMEAWSDGYPNCVTIIKYRY